MLERYQKVRDQMRTGDIVLFHGKGVISDLIRLGTGSHWSHVGLVCRLDIEGEDVVMLWESTTLSNVPDFETGQPRKGVQLVDLSSRLAHYDGEAAWCTVNAPQSEPERRRALARIRREFRGRPYEESNFELIRSAIDTIDLLSQQPDASSLFCSEAATYAHQALGWLPPEISPNEVTPADFATTNNLPWVDGVKVYRPYPIL